MMTASASVEGSGTVWSDNSWWPLEDPTVPDALPGDPEQSGEPHSALTPVPVLTPSPIGQLTPVLWAGQ
jgi:hypothetical protein